MRQAIVLLVFAAVLVSATPRCHRHHHRHGGDSERYTGLTAKPVHAKSLKDLPESFSWCGDNQHNVNFCTAMLNQHIPEYCGACFLHGALHAANDRIRIMKGAVSSTADVLLARQAFINCASQHGLGAGCEGGEPFDVYEYMHRYGLPDETCQTYVAKASAKCDPINICQNCMPVNGENKCWAVTNFTRYYAKAYGRVKGEEQIMSEILARGPVTCSFATTEEFDYDYLGGIWTHESKNQTEPDHDVEVVGWGVSPTGTKYWIARNSWGTYWGNNGWFKIMRGVNLMHFEEDCAFALIDISEEDLVADGKLVGGMYGLRHKPHKRQLEDDDPIADEEHKHKHGPHHHGPHHHSRQSNTPPRSYQDMARDFVNHYQSFTSAAAAVPSAIPEPMLLNTAASTVMQQAQEAKSPEIDNPGPLMVDGTVIRRLKDGTMIIQPESSYRKDMDDMKQQAAEQQERQAEEAEQQRKIGMRYARQFVPGLKAASVPSVAQQSLASDLLPDIGLKLESDSPMPNVLADEYEDRRHKKHDQQHMPYQHHENKQAREHEEQQKNQPQSQSQSQSQKIPPIPSLEPEGQQLPTSTIDRHHQIKHQKRVTENDPVVASDPAGFNLRTPTDQPTPQHHMPEEPPLTGWAKLGLVLAALFALVLVVIVTTLIRAFINRGKEYEPLVDRQLQQQHKDHHQYTVSHHATTSSAGNNKQRV